MTCRTLSSGLTYEKLQFQMMEENGAEAIFEETRAKNFTKSAKTMSKSSVDLKQSFKKNTPKYLTTAGK